MGGASRFMMLFASPFPPLLHCPASLVFRRRLLLARHPSSTSIPRLTLLSSSPTNNTAPHPCPFPFAAANSSRRWKLHYHSQSINSESPAPTHPWPEWWNLINTLLSSQGNQSPTLSPQDAFVVYEAKELSDEFIRHASLCLAFSRSRPELLGLLSRKDIEAVVSNGTPFLFKSSLDIARRMRVYLGMEGSNMMESDKATLVDVMKYLLSYASNPSVYSERNSIYSREPVESSVRNLLCQITEISCQDPVQELSASENHQFYSGMEQTPQPTRQNVEMKRGDWICPKCSFMNFARNFKCLECEETRPKNLLTGREWQCPQCNFYNYGRNMVCLRCDCQRPGPAVMNSVRSMSELGSSNFRLAENEEKSKRGIDKVSQLDNSSDLSGAAVVDTRKNPLERRQANSQSQISMGDYGNFKGDTSETSSPGKVFDSSIQQSLDQILGYSSPVSRASAMEENVQEHLPSSSPSGFGQHQEIKYASAPFVPSSGGGFPTQDENLKTKGNKNIKSESLFTSGASPKIGSVNEKAAQISNSVRNSESVTESENKDKEQAEKSERWFQKVAELHNVKDLPSAISDEEFPEIMPLRKGENRFVISKKKDRSLTSPAYKRQAVTEQASNPKFVPFVPFPPGYFARKDTVESNDSNSPMNSSTATSPSSMVAENFSENLDGGRPRVPEDSAVDQTGSQVRSSGDSSPNLPGSVGANVVGNASQSSIGSDSRISEHSRNAKAFQSTNGPGVLPQLPNQDPRPGWTGKSLEGSAVKEPDPLDMSEEAKAERWFRRVAQIKDISELSQIPDEDFPSIMPMRKGVNRFVVSKRKTPLERRLTSPQYRRNLPVVSSDPVKKDNDNK